MGGVVDETGYCGTCGMAPLRTTSRRAPSGSPGGGATRPSQQGSGPSAGTAVPPGPWWGRGLVPLEQAAEPEPRLLDSARVPEKWRWCEGCGYEVGRHGRDRGQCPRCRTPFDFTPRLRAGDLVDDRYQILGVLSHGGFGWAYLAEDTNLSHRVVLKGVIRDQTAATLERERTLLTQLHHQYIVRIWNYVPDGHYLVTEYAGGQTLRPVTSSEPLESLLALGLQLLEAIDYLHAKGLLHCDVKPANIVRGGDRVRLIDFGAVRLIGDPKPVAVFTESFAPPKGDPEYLVPTEGFDLYSVGRTLAELCRDHLDFAPDRPGVRSLQLLVERATHPEPGRRFVSARQFAEQLSGVIQQVIGRSDAPHRSVVFASMAEALDGGLGYVLPLDQWAQASLVGRRMVELPGNPYRCPAPEEVAAALPFVLPDPWDRPAAEGVIVAEANLNDCHAAIRRRDLVAAEKLLADSRLPEADWRAAWYRGLIALARAEVTDAAAAFQRVRKAMPGELMPLLALGLCSEIQGQQPRADVFYGQVSGADESVIASHFGRARILLAAGDRAEAAGALERVPAASRFKHAARIAMIRSLSAVVVADGRTAAPEAGDCERARSLAQELRQERHLDETSAELELLNAESTYADAVRESTTTGLSDDIRSQLESALRRIARYARSPDTRATLVDLANDVRPRTFL